MTIPATPRKAGPYVGTGALAQYSFNFPVTSASHLVVVEANAYGFETTLTPITDYTVALNPNQQTAPGGTVTRKAGPLPTGYRWTILSSVPLEQPVDLPPGGAFSAVVVENGLDNIVMQVQQLAEEIGRAIKVGATESIAPNELLDAAFAAASAAQAAAAEAAAAVAYPPGTRMVFAQAAAPTGWTQVTNVNDRVLRVVSGAGGGTGGGWTITGLWSGGTVLTPEQMPSHAHWTVGDRPYTGVGGIGAGDTAAIGRQGADDIGAGQDQYLLQPATGPADRASSSITGGGQAHSHTVSQNGNWRPAYLDIIVASKN